LSGEPVVIKLREIAEVELLKISEYVTLSAERKCHPLANQPTTAS
jgi:hypothetical protein